MSRFKIISPNENLEEMNAPEMDSSYGIDDLKNLFPASNKNKNQEYSQKALNPEELDLIEKIESYSDFFKKMKQERPEEDFSKNFIIFSFNYFDLGLKTEAQEMLKEVEPTYFSEKFLKDMEEAIWHKQLALDFERRNKLREAREHNIEAEYFLVAIKILSFLDEGNLMKNHAHYQEFKKQILGKKFELNFLPKLKVVNE